MGVYEFLEKFQNFEVVSLAWIFKNDVEIAFVAFYVFRDFASLFCWHSLEGRWPSHVTSYLSNDKILPCTFTECIVIVVVAVII